MFGIRMKSNNLGGVSGNTNILVLLIVLVCYHVSFRTSKSMDGAPDQVYAWPMHT